MEISIESTRINDPKYDLMWGHLILSWNPPWHSNTKLFYRSRKDCSIQRWWCVQGVPGHVDWTRSLRQRRRSIADVEWERSDSVRLPCGTVVDYTKRCHHSQIIVITHLMIALYTCWECSRIGVRFVFRYLSLILLLPLKTWLPFHSPTSYYLSLSQTLSPIRFIKSRAIFSARKLLLGMIDK